MAFTQTDLDRIESAIAKGELSVTFADRTVMYRSVEELIKARNAIAASLASGRPKQTLLISRSGF